MTDEPASNPVGMPERPTEDFAGRRVLVTGGSRGLGRAIAMAYLTAGATVTTCARRPPDTPVETTAGAAHFVACDVRDNESIAAMVGEAANHMGGIDILINNAGGAPPAAATDSRGSFNEKIVALNLVGPMNVAIAAHQHLHASTHGGVIVNISSISGMRANPLGVAYGAAKAGLINMTETLALEWGPQVRVITVSAGPLAPDSQQDHFDASEVERLTGALALGRLGTAADVVEAVLFATSGRASWMSGSNLVIDGGPTWPSNGYPRP